jgi:hypothetical protein
MPPREHPPLTLEQVVALTHAVMAHGFGQVLVTVAHGVVVGAATTFALRSSEEAARLLTYTGTPRSWAHEHAHAP